MPSRTASYRDRYRTVFESYGFKRTEPYILHLPFRFLVFYRGLQNAKMGTWHLYLCLRTVTPTALKLGPFPIYKQVTVPILVQ